LKSLGCVLEREKNLSLNELADQSAFIGYVSEGLNNCQMFNWWVEEENYQLFTHRVYASKVSFPLNFFIPYSMRKSIIGKLKFNDYTSENADMVYDKADEIYRSLSVKLGNQNYFFGDSPTTLDSLVYGFLITQSAAKIPKDNLRNFISNYHNLVEYCNRITTTFFGPDIKASLVYIPYLRNKKKKPTKTTEQTKKEHFERCLLIGGLALLMYFAYNWNFTFSREIKALQNEPD